MIFSIILMCISIAVGSPINKTHTAISSQRSLNVTDLSLVQRQESGNIFVGDMCTHPTFGTSIRQNDPNYCFFTSLTTYPYKAGNQNKYDIHTLYLFRNTCDLIGYNPGISQGDGERFAFDSELPQVLVVETSQSAKGGIHPHIFYGASGNNLPECWNPVNGIVPQQLACKLWFQCHCDGPNGFC